MAPFNVVIEITLGASPFILYSSLFFLSFFLPLLFRCLLSIGLFLAVGRRCSFKATRALFCLPVVKVNYVAGLSNLKVDFKAFLDTEN